MMSPACRPAASAGQPGKTACAATVGADERAVVDRQVLLGGERRVDRDVVDADPGADERLHAVEGLLHDRLGDVDRDREAEALRVGLTAVLTPMTWPALFTSGPPELPGLMAASVWIRLRSVSALVWVASEAWIWRPRPETTPVVTVFS